jgi:DNA-binding transcriptional regulator GbsR (MarR family)
MNPQDELSALLEKLDIPRVPAQIIALLLAHDPPALSFGEIQAALGVSKGAVSMGVSYLQALELINFSTVSGTRRRLVQTGPTHFVAYMRRRMTYFRAFAAVLQEVASKHGDTVHGRELLGVAELCRDLDNNVATMLTTWEMNTNEQRRRDLAT